MASATTLRRWRDDNARCASAESARMPPSPRLSARRMTITYLSVTTTKSDQKISESTPSRLASVSGRTRFSPNTMRIV